MQYSDAFLEHIYIYILKNNKLVFFNEHTGSKLTLHLNYTKIILLSINLLLLLCWIIVQINNRHK